MKKTAFFLGLISLFILSGCQIAKAPDNGVEVGGGDALSEEVIAPATGEDTEAPADDEGELLLNPNYDAKLDGSPTDLPTNENENDSKTDLRTKVDQGFMSDPNQ